MQNRTNATDGHLKTEGRWAVKCTRVIQGRNTVKTHSVSYTQKEMIAKHLDVVNVRAVNPKVRFVYIM